MPERLTKQDAEAELRRLAKRALETCSAGPIEGRGSRATEQMCEVGLALLAIADGLKKNRVHKVIDKDARHQAFLEHLVEPFEKKVQERLSAMKR